MSITAPKNIKDKSIYNTCSVENNIKCPSCNSDKFRKSGFRQYKDGKRQVYRCKECFRRFTIDKYQINADLKNLYIKNNHNYKELIGKGTFLKEQKAKIILSREHSIRKVNEYIYLVQSQTGTGWYKVQWNGKDWVCNCPDYVKNGHISPCKHLLALKIRYDTGFYEQEEEILKIEPKKYTQNWHNYNLAQTNENDLFDKFLYQLASYVKEPKLKLGAGRPSHSLKDLIFCCVIKIYSQKSVRLAEHLFREALERQQISKKIHCNAISRTLLNRELTPILLDLVHFSARSLASIETDFAYDSSGFRCSSFGYYCEDKHGTKKQRNYLKCHIGTGVSTNIVASVVITDEHVADSPQLKKLLLDTAKNFTIQNVYADMAYSSKKNLQFIDSVGGKPFIPFKKNTTGKRGCKLWRKAFHYFQLHKDEFLKQYHKRSNAESTFSAIKRKFGETIKSRNRIAQENELLCKIIAYNITVLIHEMVQLNGTTELLSFDGLQKEISLNV
jgi:transposase/predicted nucleic acid-binding Zn finger protein